MSRKQKKLSIDQVKHIAELANLELSEQDLLQFKDELSDTIDFVDQLRKLKTQGVEPTTQVTGLTNVFREDMILPSLPADEVLQNAARKYKNYFVVKAIFE